MATQTAKAPVFGSEADAAWGYRFGVDGLMSFEEACGHLGNPSRAHMERLVADRKIRKGRDGARVVFCRRSVAEHASGREL